MFSSLSATEQAQLGERPADTVELLGGFRSGNPDEARPASPRRTPTASGLGWTDATFGRTQEWT